MIINVQIFMNNFFLDCYVANTRLPDSILLNNTNFFILKTIIRGKPPIMK